MQTIFKMPYMPRPTLSICVPVYEEAENLPLLHAAIVEVIDPNQIEAELMPDVKAAFTRDLDLRRFEVREPTLHDAFILLTEGRA